MDNNSEQQGLSFLYNDSEVPNYHNVDTMEMRCLLRSILETNQENIALTREITNILPKLNLELKTLPNDIKEGLDKVISIMKAEKILEFDEIAICIARQRKEIEEKAQQREERHLLQMHNELCKNRARLLKKLDHLEESVHSLENTITTGKNDDLYCNMMFLSAKLKEYQQTEKKLETDLNDMEVEELYPEKILEKHKLYLELLSDLANVKQFLDPYHDLPPNLTEAKLMLESKRKEFKELEQQIFHRMND
ncbi:AUGMIN subunit 1-like [Odontomachus brunneus]|uniref:AUGMIN subunit 1-like n=1 Tax=Odontomachus brunneus TaxID=486640 RepID=UPI0013F236AD|nr:AUGMIN subunit 1-like [Odontomachus brunneus]XP_032682584.1 AUGMIN subunit 1-like [Odontomachus brunneus]XP_032682586.1 AUGMIN subunit 1-like [Odontomachus brunneus]XP_032682587.1 AUGMIN subunit 1-like [Odontomachus brunneus]XP_032682588.1 AUGMIN subunit 1-like [Odontomachus brunneus]XP_032682589.1 AUGMIN subunit 1-like [Odontomachus brunneus]XP_032682590.1 AUGMIN subunit 1-like [Odontomachus brunneus]XP_032682591.1 AUGMIN subunit 1-like [Odontomachus brunneus]XP_032682592.1 AUGMIN subun